MLPWNTINSLATRCCRMARLSGMSFSFICATFTAICCFSKKLFTNMQPWPWRSAALFHLSCKWNNNLYTHDCTRVDNVLFACDAQDSASAKSSRKSEGAVLHGQKQQLLESVPEEVEGECNVNDVDVAENEFSVILLFFCTHFFRHSFLCRIPNLCCKCLDL